MRGPRDWEHLPGRTILQRLMFLALVGVANVFGAIVGREENPISLAGTWRFRLDPKNIGVEEKWFAEKLDDSVTLPGTTDTNHKGIFKDERAVDRLSRVWYWKGPAWYQREVVIPDAWQGKRITLLLERTKNTRVWVDDKDCGAEDTLSAPQVFDLTRALTPGQHTITVLVDNAKLPPVGPSHAVDERTQTNWNGIIGRMELRATDPVWLEDVQVYPDAARKQARVRVVVGNITGQPAAGRITVGCESYNVAAPAAFPTQSVVGPGASPAQRRRVHLPAGRGGPAVGRVPAGHAASGAEAGSHRRRSVLAPTSRRSPSACGISKGRESAWRSTAGRSSCAAGLDCANYPLTGYPPMDKDGWRRVLGDHQGLGPQPRPLPFVVSAGGGVRGGRRTGDVFPGRSCRTSAARSRPRKARRRRIATSITSTWRATGANVSLYDYARREGELIFRHFGNHPSFVMFTLGNELGRNPAMFELVAHFRELDPRHLYAQGSNNMHWEPSFAEGDDFWVTGKTGKTLPVRGAFFPADFPDGGHIEYRPPSTMVDYSESIEGRAGAGHRSRNRRSSRSLPTSARSPSTPACSRRGTWRSSASGSKDAHMLDSGHDFVRASGASVGHLLPRGHRGGLAHARLRRLPVARPPGLSRAGHGAGGHAERVHGIQGDHRAREMAAVLLRNRAAVALWRNTPGPPTKHFAGEIKIAHYGAADIRDARVTWTVGEGAGPAVASGALGPLTIKQGEVSSAGRIRVPLDRVKAPRQLQLTVAIAGHPVSEQL